MAKGDNLWCHGRPQGDRLRRHGWSGGTVCGCCTWSGGTTFEGTIPSMAATPPALNQINNIITFAGGPPYHFELFASRIDGEHIRAWSTISDTFCISPIHSGSHPEFLVEQISAVLELKDLQIFRTTEGNYRWRWKCRPKALRDVKDVQMASGKQLIRTTLTQYLMKANLFCFVLL